MKLFRNVFALWFVVVSLGAGRSYADSPSVEADKLFDNTTIPQLVLYVSPKQWNYLLSNFNTNQANDQYIKADKFVFQPMTDGKAAGTPTILPNIQLKLKGNTSRICPETGTNGCGPHVTGYGAFHQANFKLKFKDADSGDKQYLYGYEKLDIKSFKGQMNKAREIYSFQTLADILGPVPGGQYSLAPHIGHAHLYIAIQGDNSAGNAYNPLDASQRCDNGYYCYDFGYYEIMEPVNSDGYLDTRFASHKGYMWKGNSKEVCFTGLDIDSSGSCNLDAFKQAVAKASASNCADGEPCDASIPFGIKNEPWNGVNAYKPAYDYQSSEKNFDKAMNLFAAFIYNLNYLSASAPEGGVSPLETWIVDGTTPDGWSNPFDPDNRQGYRFDYQSFLTTMAFDVAIGSWDDYWYNRNNFALYFDKENKIVHFIPNDYDTVLGSLPSKDSRCGTVMGTVVKTSFGLSPSRQGQRPLISRLLGIPRFAAVYQQALGEIKLRIDQTVADDYAQFARQYQLICRNFKQSKGADCTSTDPNDYLCANPQYINNGADAKCDSGGYLTLPNQTSGTDTVGLPAGRSKIVADQPVWYGASFYRLYSSSRYGTQQPTANYFLTTQYNLGTGYRCN
ncbi:CotH kinase family protein [Endothiovibrio diazotrophicus]